MKDAGSAARNQCLCANHSDSASHGNDRHISLTISTRVRCVRSRHSTTRMRASRKISGAMPQQCTRDVALGLDDFVLRHFFFDCEPAATKRMGQVEPQNSLAMMLFLQSKLAGFEQVLQADHADQLLFG